MCSPPPGAFTGASAATRAEAAELARHRPEGCTTFTAAEIDAMACRRFTLGPGDVLYLPQGMPHDALAHTGGATHLTVALLRQGMTWADMLQLAARGRPNMAAALRAAALVPEGAVLQRLHPHYLHPEDPAVLRAGSALLNLATAIVNSPALQPAGVRAAASYEDVPAVAAVDHATLLGAFPEARDAAIPGLVRHRRGDDECDSCVCDSGCDGCDSSCDGGCDGGCDGILGGSCDNSCDSSCDDGCDYDCDDSCDHDCTSCDCDAGTAQINGARYCTPCGNGQYSLLDNAASCLTWCVCPP